MIRVQASLLGQTGDVYRIEARAVDYGSTFTFSIRAKSADKAAMKAIRRVEEMEDKIVSGSKT